MNRVLVINHDWLSWRDIRSRYGLEKWVNGVRGRYRIKFVTIECVVTSENLREWLGQPGNRGPIVVFAHEATGKNPKGVRKEESPGFQRKYCGSKWWLFSNDDRALPCQLIQHYAEGCPEQRQDDFRWEKLQEALDRRDESAPLAERVAPLDILIQGWLVCLGSRRGDPLGWCEEGKSAFKAKVLLNRSVPKSAGDWFSLLKEESAGMVQALDATRAARRDISALRHVAQAIADGNVRSLNDERILKKAHAQFSRMVKERDSSDRPSIPLRNILRKDCGKAIGDQLHILMNYDWRKKTEKDKKEAWDFLGSVKRDYIGARREEFVGQIDRGLKEMASRGDAVARWGEFQAKEFREYDSAWLLKNIRERLDKGKAAELPTAPITALNDLLRVRDLHKYLTDPKKADSSPDLVACIQRLSTYPREVVCCNRLLLEEVFFCFASLHPRNACPPVRWQYSVRSLAYRLRNILGKDMGEWT